LPNLAHKIRIYPSHEAEVYLLKSCGTARFSWNWALAHWSNQYKEGGKPSALSLNREFNALKGDAFPWTSEVSKWVTNRTILNLGEAFSRFFRKESRYPRFKKRGRRDSFYLNQDVLKVSGRYLKLPKLEKPIKMAEVIRFPGRVLSCVISRDSAGDWYSSFNLELPGDYSYPHKCKNQAVVGVDVGIKTLATCSDGTKFDNPRALRAAERRLKHRQRALSRKQKGSKNRAKARISLAKAHRKVTRIRHDAWHRVTSWLVKSFWFIGIEDLNVRGMTRNHKIAKSVSDAAFYEFRRQIEYKSRLAGGHVAVADRFYPSSKLCSCCGYKLESLDLSEREWACPRCGAVHNRDENASKNLELVALRYRETLNACGEGVRPEPSQRAVFRRSSVKQECPGRVVAL
jgi:putative transposase